MQCVLKQGMGWDGLARERSQVIPVEGSSHVALLKIGGIVLKTEGMFELKGVGCHLTSLLP